MAKRRRKLPTYVIEALAGIAILLSVNHLWFSDNFGYLGVSPSPYWLVVIFVAMRYGELAGLVAGAMCAAALVLSTSYNTVATSEELWYHIPYQQWKLAGLFVVFGFLAGQERSRMEKVVITLREKFNRLKSEFEGLAMEALALNKVKTELEGRILGQADTVNTIYEVARRLTNLKVEEIYPAVPSLVKKVIGAQSCALYTWDGNGYMLISSDGARKWAGSLDTGCDIIKVVLRTRKAASVRDIIASEGMSWDEQKDPPMAAPLFFGQAKDSVSGIIIVHDIPFTRLNADSMNFLSIISDWISRSIENVYYSTHIQLEDIFDPETGLFRYDYGLRRLREEMLACSVRGCSTALMLIKIADLPGFAEGSRKENYQKVCAAIRNAVRSNDLVSLTESPETFMVVFPGADRKAAEAIKKRIISGLETALISPYEGRDDKLKFKIAAVFAGKGSSYLNETDALNDAKKVLAG